MSGMRKTQWKDAFRNILRRKAAWLSMAFILFVGVAGLLLIVTIGGSVEKSVEDFYTRTNFRDVEIDYALGFSEDSLARLRAVDGVQDLEGYSSVSALATKGHPRSDYEDEDDGSYYEDEDDGGDYEDESYGDEYGVEDGEDGDAGESEADGESAEDSEDADGGEDGDTGEGEADDGSAETETTAEPEEYAEIVSRSVTVVTYTERISVPVVVAGRLPANGWECAMDEALAERMGLQIGDRLEVLIGGMQSNMVQGVSVLDIVGLVNHPHNVTRVQADTVLVAPEYFSGYTGVLVKLDMPEEIRAKVLSDEYQARVEEQLPALRETFPEIRETRIKEVRASMEESELVREFLREKGIAMSDLEDWLQDPDTDNPLIVQKKTELEDMLTEMDTDYETASTSYHELLNSDIIIQNRRMNVSYEQIRMSARAIRQTSLYVAPFFALIAAVVFFSSILLIISDQKNQVGTMKALGFRKGKIRARYLVFGLSAALIGSALGFVLVILVSGTAVKMLEEQYAIGSLTAAMPPLAAAGVIAGAVLLALLVAWAACRRLLACSATGLMSGSEPVRKDLRGSRKGQRKRSLYAELILNNIRTDKARVLVVILVIAASTILFGMSITLRQSLHEAFRYQMEDMVKYDLQIRMVDGIPDYKLEGTKEIIEREGGEFTSVYQGGTLIRTKDGDVGVTMLCMDREQISRYLNVNMTGKEGIAVSYNLSAAYGIKRGGTVSLFSRTLNIGEAPVTDVFEYSIGMLLVIPTDTYEEVFGSTCGENTLLVKCPADRLGGLEAALRDQDAGIGYYIALTRVSDSVEELASLKNLFDFVVIGMVLLAAMMNMLIMVNLTGILLERRMKELQLMRVNGFSMKQVMGYLTRETHLTGLAGIVLGIAAGIPFARLLVRSVSVTNLSLSADIVWIAWVIAAGLCAVLSWMINAVCFRKVRKASLVNITQQ